MYNVLCIFLSHIHKTFASIQDAHFTVLVLWQGGCLPKLEIVYKIWKSNKEWYFPDTFVNHVFYKLENSVYEAGGSISL